MKLKKEVISLVLAGSLVLGGVSYLPNGGVTGNVASAADTTTVKLDDLVGEGFWAKWTNGVKFSEQETTFDFTATIQETATVDGVEGSTPASHDCPIVVLFSSSDGKVNGPDYKEYYVLRGDAYGWKGTAATGEPDLQSEGAPATDEAWATWVTEVQKGVASTGSVKLDNGKAVLKLTVNGVTSTATVPVIDGAEVYVALSGEYCTLSNIEFTVPVDAADATSGSSTTASGSGAIPSNPDGDTNTNPGTTSTTSPANSPAASTAPGASTAPDASAAPDASQAPSDGDNTPGATQAPSDGDNTPGATQTPSDGDDTPGATQEPDDGDKNTTSTTPKKQTNVTAAAQNGVTIKVNTKKNGTAVISTIKKTTKKTVTINSTVTVNGVKYKVTTIGAKAFAKCTKATKVNLPSTITTIKKNAFAGAKKLKTIKITSKKAVTVKKGAFKGLSTKKMTIKVSKKNMTKKQFKTTKKNLKNAGFKGTIKRV